MGATDKQERFFALLEPHQKILFKVSRVYCAHEAERQDLIQEITLQLWRSFERFDGRSKPSTWVYRVALNVAVSFERERQRHLRGVVFVEDGVLEAASAQPPTSDEAEALRQLLGRLEPLERALLLLYIDGYDHEAIGEILGLSATNVATKIGRTKQRLRDEAK